jgi:hypothetical protein
VSASESPVARPYPALEPQADSFHPMPSLSPDALRFALNFDKLDPEDRAYIQSRIARVSKLS